MKKLTNKEFLDKIWSINPSYKERFCYELCLYTGMKNKIKITCKKHNCLFEVIATNHFRSAKREIKENILFGTEDAQSAKSNQVRSFEFLIVLKLKLRFSQ